MARSAASKEHSASSGQKGTVSISANNSDSTNVGWEIHDMALVELGDDVDLRSFSNTIGNNHGRSSVSSLFGSVSYIESSYCLGKVPFSGSQSRCSLLMISRGVLEHFKGSLTGRKCFGKLSLGDFKLTLSLSIGLLGQNKLVTSLSKLVFSSPQVLFSIIDFLLCIIEVFIGTLELLPSVVKCGSSLSVLEFLLIKDRLSLLKVVLSNVKSLLGLVKLRLSFF